MRGAKPVVRVTIATDGVIADHYSVVVTYGERVEHGVYTSLDVALVAVNSFIRRVLAVPS